MKWKDEEMIFGLIILIIIFVCLSAHNYGPILTTPYTYKDLKPLSDSEKTTRIGNQYYVD